MHFNQYSTQSRLNNMTTNNYLDDPTEEEALALFKAIKEKFPSGTLGTDKWYIVTVCMHYKAPF
jgi:hypothetical protein